MEVLLKSQDYKESRTPKDSFKYPMKITFSQPEQPQSKKVTSNGDGKWHKRNKNSKANIKCILKKLFKILRTQLWGN